MSTEESYVEALADSAHALELRRGVSHLRFGEPLESQYIAAHLDRVQLRVRLWFSIGAIISFIYSVVQALRTGVFSPGFAMEFLVVFPCAMALAWLAWSERYYRQFYMRLAPALVTVKGAFAAYFIAPLIGKAYDEEVGILAIYVVAAFFFSGLLFRPALFAAAAIVISWAVTVISLGLLSTLALKCFALLFVTAVMGALVYGDVERSYRRGFLESAIIHELVTRDGLTGLLNRRALDEQLLRVWLQAQRDRRTLAVLMIDIDHFKAYNDSHGHQAGDLVLRSVAGLLKDFTRRPLDIAARYGGEEFAVIVYDLPPCDLRDTAERLRKSVEHAALGVTISIGAGSVTPSVGRTLEGALQFADEALYRAKDAGRNCIVVSEPEEHADVMTGMFRASLGAVR